jgi:MFS family permease
VALWIVPRNRDRGASRQQTARVNWWKGLAQLPWRREAPFLAAAWRFNLLVFLTVQGVLLATLVVLVQRRGLAAFGFADQGTAGVVMAAMMASSSVMAIVLGRRLDRLRLRSSLVVPGLAGLASGFAVLAFGHSLWQIFLGAMLVGGSFNGINLPMLALLGDVTPTEHYGRAVGLYQLFGDVGGSLGPVVGLEASLHFGMLPTYLAASALLLLSAPMALWAGLRERARRRENAFR